MAISINWATRVIFIPKADMSVINPGPPEVRQLNVNTFRLALKDLEDGEEGMPFPDTHAHATEKTLSGVAYARQVEIINGYTVEFEDGMYSVSCIGANHNLGDVKVVNSVSLIIGNSAGLQVVSIGSGVTEQDKLDIADRVLDELLAGHNGIGSIGALLSSTATDAANAVSSADYAAGEAANAATEAATAAIVAAAAKDAADAAAAAAAVLEAITGDIHDARFGGWELDAVACQQIYRRADGSVLKRFNLFDKNGNPSVVNVYRRVPV